MPVFTPPISTQNQAGSSGQYSYPMVGGIKRFSIFQDEFNRSVLNPANSYQIYTTNFASTGSTNTNNSHNLAILTAATTNDYSEAIVANWVIKRAAQYIDARSQISIDIIFYPTAATNIQFYVGLLNSTAAATALPTTAGGMGVFLDTSASTHLFLTSADGTTQTKTDTGVVADGNARRLNITWTANNSAVLTLYDTDYVTSKSTQTVTALGITNQAQPLTIHFWVESLANAVKTLNCIEYQISCT